MVGMERGAIKETKGLAHPMIALKSSQHDSWAERSCRVEGAAGVENA